MNFEAIAITAVAGLLAGRLTGFVMKRGGYGLTTDIALGVVGGVVGGFVLWMQRAAAAESRFAMLAAAFLGAFILLVVQRKFWSVKMAVRT